MAATWNIFIERTIHNNQPSTSKYVINPIILFTKIDFASVTTITGKFFLLNHT